MEWDSVLVEKVAFIHCITAIASLEESHLGLATVTRFRNKRRQPLCLVKLDLNCKWMDQQQTKHAALKMCRRIYHTKVHSERHKGSNVHPIYRTQELGRAPFSLQIVCFNIRALRPVLWEERWRSGNWTRPSVPCDNRTIFWSNVKSQLIYSGTQCKWSSAAWISRTFLLGTDCEQ